jgi:hypothetical protein
MIVNVCCCGSSGSTFFSNLINRHPEIVCGDELGLFSKPVFYDNYNHLKKYHFLIKRAGITSYPYFQDRSILRNLQSFLLTGKQVWRWVLESNDIIEFTSRLKSHILEITGKSIWAEKTPTNIYLIGEFLKVFPEAKVIHIVRDPRDVILSLMSRGASISRGAERWLTAVSAIYNYRNHPNVLEIKYEDLILESEKTMNRVCSHLNVEFDMDFFATSIYESKNIVKKDGFVTWGSRPGDDFSSKSIGKFKSSDIDFTDILSMTLTSEFASILKVEQLSFSQLAAEFGYQLGDISKIKKANLSRSVAEVRQGIVFRILDLLIERNKYFQRVVY